MKYVLFILFSIVLLAYSQSSQAQNAEDKLYLKSNFWGNKFYKGDTIYSINGVLEELAINEQPYNLMLKAKKDNTFAQIFGAAGGLLIGWPIGTALGGGEPKWCLAGIGAAFAAISIPLSINFKKKANQAIKDHYSLITGSSKQRYKPTYHMGMSATSVKLRVQF